MSLVSPWKPMTNALDLKHLGKLNEELGEASSAVARCIIQGIDGREPVTNKSNRNWLEEELADVLANIGLVVGHFNLDREFINYRAETKARDLKQWHRLET